MSKANFKPEWLNWCRLCASDEAEINLLGTAHKDLVKIISKCFDVEMTFEEPELGSMLCFECHSLMGQLSSFYENVNKVQAIFELLRHTEPNEHLDMVELRRQYGLTTVKAMKSELSKEEAEEVTEEDLQWMECLISPEPKNKRKRGRPPKGMAKAAKKSQELLEYGSDFDMPQLPEPECIVDEATALTSASNKITNTTCTICQETLSSVSALKSHKYRNHGNQTKRFICDCCGKQLKTNTALAEHKLVHTDDRPCVCSICHAAFKNKARLRVHTQTHGEPSFQCKICGKKLQTRAIWNKHKYVHSEERRFKCDICGAGCKNSTAMKVHLLSHTGLRPYVCKYCGKGFASNTNCRSHKLKKHPLQAEQEDDNDSSRIPVPTLDELRAMTREMAKMKKEKSTETEMEA